MHVAIVGSRDFRNLERVRKFVRALAAKYPDAVIVSGGARGVDLTAESAAGAAGLRWYSFRPRERADGRFEIVIVSNDGLGSLPATHHGSYPSYGKAAFARNRSIVQHTQQVVAFTNGSRGTANSIDIARSLGIPTHVYEEDH